MKDRGSSLLISVFIQKSQFCIEPDLVLVCSSLYSIKIFTSTSVQHQSSHMHLYKRIGHMHQSDHMDHSSHMLYQKCISTTSICLSTNQVMCIVTSTLIQYQCHIMMNVIFKILCINIINL